MKVESDPAADALYVSLVDADVAESDEVRPGVILDYDKDGRLVGVEVLYVSRRQPGELVPAEASGAA